MAQDITNLIAPTFSSNKINYRIPDNSLTPTMADKDYFYSPEEKVFIFMDKPGEKNFVTIDFIGFDNSFFDGKTFKTI